MKGGRMLRKKKERNLERLKERDKQTQSECWKEGKVKESIGGKQERRKRLKKKEKKCMKKK